MGWLKRLSEGFEEAFATLPPGKTGASENLIKQYFRQRYKIESCRENGEEVDAFELKKYETLQKRIRRKDIDVEKKYQKFKAERKSLPKEEGEALDVAEDTLQEPTVRETKTSFVTPKQDEELTDESEEDHFSPDGAVTSVKKTTIIIAGCGKRLSSKDEIAGFCAECKKAVCSEHIRYCAGYDNIPCGKLLCKKHTYPFIDEDGTEQPCCADHYNMRVYLKKNLLDSDSEPGKKPKKPEKESD
jgi:hypothetical protein